MNSPLWRFFPGTLIVIGLAFSVPAGAAEKLRALLVTGGCCHDYQIQKALITAGISERSRIPIEWTVVHPEGDKADLRIPIYEKENWAEGFDIVVHNECVLEVKDSEWIDKILEPHRNGIPAVLLHCTLQSYPDEAGKWKEFSGATSTQSSGPETTHEVKLSDPRHPIAKRLWEWPVRERLFPVSNLHESAKIIAQSHPGGAAKPQPAAWLHEYSDKKTNVFVTTLGDRKETISQPGYLNLLTAGFLWAAGEDPEENLIIVGSEPGIGKEHFIPGENLLTDSYTSSSSQNSNFATDGNITTNWQTGEGDIINWWQTKLPEAKEIASVYLFWKQPATQPYWLEASGNGTKWTRVADLLERKTGTRIHHHKIGGTFQYLRVSNPETGLVNPISEVAAFSSQGDIPFHLITEAELTTEFTPRKEPVKPSITRTPVLRPERAFSLLDTPRSPMKWSLALEELSGYRNAAAVDGLIHRINTTESGELRHLCLSALACLYRDNQGNQWAESKKIAAFFVELFPRQRINKEQLLKEILRHDIEIDKIETVVESVDGLSIYKDLLLNTLSESRIPYNALSFLTSIVKDESETIENRLKACSMLARSTDMLAMRDAFEQIAGISVTESEKSKIIEVLSSNTTWEAQLDWLLEKAEAELPEEQVLAREVLASIYRDPLSKKSSKEKISTLLSNPEKPTRTFAGMNPEEIKTRIDETVEPDPEKGKLIYQQHCSRCHDSYTSKLTDWNPGQKFHSAIPTFQFRMKDKKMYSGFIGKEGEQKITVIDQAGNAVQLSKGNIQSRAELPAMKIPDVVSNRLTVEERAALSAYIATLK